MKPVRFRSRFISWFGRSIISGLVSVLFRVRVTGRENAPAEGPFLLVSNHGHVIDPIALQPYFKPWIHWVAKAELFRNPLLGGFMRGLGAISFERDRADMAAMRRIVALVKAGEAVGIFPEGRRVNRGEKGKLEPKAATAHLARRFNLTLVPAAVTGGFKLFRRTSIYIGKPFRLEALGEGSDLFLTEKIMEHIYALIPSGEAGS